jgi:hypothetical protein
MFMHDLRKVCFQLVLRGNPSLFTGYNLYHSQGRDNNSVHCVENDNTVPKLQPVRVEDNSSIGNDNDS